MTYSTPKIRYRYYIYLLSIMLGIFISNYKPMLRGDIGLYQSWSESFFGGSLLGLNETWVYPYVAMLPMIASLCLSFIFKSYAVSWIVIIIALNILAFTVFEKAFREKINIYHIIAYSLVNIFLFGIFLFRLDGIAIPATLIAVALFKRYKYFSYFILFIFALIKIWPIAFIFGLWLSSNRKIKDSIVLVVYAILFMVIPNIFYGHVFDFIGLQKDRGIQIESIFATPFAFVGDSFYFDNQIITHQVKTTIISGPYIAIATYLMFFVITVSSFIFWHNNRKSFNFEKGLLLSSYITIVFISLNKIGSPQFLGWMQVVIFALAVALPWDSLQKKLLAIIICSVFFTGLLTPIFYTELINQTYIGSVMLVLKSSVLIALTIFFTTVMLKPKPIG